jgi:hypothetical protein
MNDDTQEEQGRSSRGAVWVWICWLGVVVMVYVLSVGPRMMITLKKEPEVGTGVVRMGGVFRPCQYSKWATCPGSAELTGGGVGLGRVLQPGTFLDDSLFPVTRLAASVGNRHHPKVIGSLWRPGKQNPPWP